MRSQATLRGYGISPEAKHQRYEEAHPEELRMFRSRQLEKIAAVHDLGDLLAHFVKATHQRKQHAGGRKWLTKGR